MSTAVYLNLDDAWTDPPIPMLDAREWGPRLRYLARKVDIDRFYHEVACELPPFILYGSGDFHHLAAVFLRKITRPVTIVSFDNHPDWDVRPPRWSCGAWVSRALEMPHIEQVSVWGCGNFELSFPSRLTANRAGLRSGRLTIHAWAERQSPATQRRFNCMTRENWRERFLQFAQSLEGKSVHVTIDMDCLRAEEVVTNWENGLFTAVDVAWAISQLRNVANVIGGDVCGAWSVPAYTRRFQQLAGWWDHPAVSAGPHPEARAINQKSLDIIWPTLVG